MAGRSRHRRHGWGRLCEGSGLRVPVVTNELPGDVLGVRDRRADCQEIDVRLASLELVLCPERREIALRHERSAVVEGGVDLARPQLIGVASRWCRPGRC